MEGLQPRKRRIVLCKWVGRELVKLMVRLWLWCVPPPEPNLDEPVHTLRPYHRRYRLQDDNEYV